MTDPLGGQAALILVLHHVLADGLGGLAILAALADPGLPAPTRTFPQRPPQWRELAVDAAREKIRVASTLPTRLRRGLAGLRELGLGPRRPRLIERTSPNRPTSKRRQFATVTVPLADIVTAAHRAGGTVNDVVLAAVTGALITELQRSWRASGTAGGLSAGVGTAIRDRGPARQQHRCPADRRSDTRRRQRPTRRDHRPDPDKP